MAFGLLLAVLVIEVGLRLNGFNSPVTHQADPFLGSRMRPNISGVYRMEGFAKFSTNSKGYRDIERSIAKPANTYRIAVIGDSYIEAMQVERDKMFSEQLQILLEECKPSGFPTIEVIPFGVSGYSPVQYYLLLQSEVLEYQPDLVVLGFLSGNDIRDSYPGLQQSVIRPTVKLVGDSLQFDHSFVETPKYKRASNPSWRRISYAADSVRVIQIAKHLRDKLNQARALARLQSNAADLELGEVGLDDFIYLKEPQGDYRSAWEYTFALLSEINTLLNRKHVNWLLVSFTNGIQLTPDSKKQAEYLKKFNAAADLFEPESKLRSFAVGEAINYLALAPLMYQIATSENRYLHGFPDQNLGAGHWNEAGHYYAAEFSAQKICEELLEARQ